MINKTYDVIIIGAGSIGVPTAVSLSEKGKKVLVLEEFAGPGQGNNKKAIGGVRATHSDYGKLSVCKRSIEIFSTWKEKHNYDIGWRSNGYSYPAWNDKDSETLQAMVRSLQAMGLNIMWVPAEEYNKLVPGIKMEGLKGSTFSPEDGSCSPLLAMSAFHKRASELGAEFHFNEKVVEFELENNKVVSVVTDKAKYSCSEVINAAGNNAREIGKKVGLDLPVFPDNHEAGITEPVKRFFEPMVIDMRKAPGSANYYFYQNHEGQVVFCITPDPPIVGVDNLSTSEFLPLVTKRMLDIYPRLKYLKLRRTWRGQYPMTPDGFPIVGRTKEIPNFINAVGMCGQGFMLGPGLGELLTKIVLKEVTPDDEKQLKSFDLYREFSGMEAFK